MRGKTLSLMIVLAANAILPGTVAATTIIDDFEISYLFEEVIGQGSSSTTHPINSPANCVAPDRDLLLAMSTPGGEVLTVLNQGAAVDDGAGVNFVGNGHAHFGYFWGTPLDLTEGGTVDRLHVLLKTAPSAGAQIALYIDDGNGNAVLDTQDVVGAGSYQFDLIQYGNTAKSAETIAVRLIESDGGYFVISDIRTFLKGNQGSILQGDLVETAWPPIPSPPISYRTFDLFGQPLYATDMIAQIVDNGGQIPLMTANLQEIPFYNGEMADMEFWWDNQGALQNTTFNISFDFKSVPGGSPEILVPPNPVYGTESFGISTELLVRDAWGDPMGTSDLNIVFNRGPTQSFTFEDVSAISHTNKNSSAAGFDVSFGLIGSDVTPGKPLFEVSVVSGWSTVITTDIESYALPVESVLLKSTPNPFNPMTKISFSLNHDTPATLRIYDVAGRIVQTLIQERTLQAGLHEVSWGGRDEQGKQVSSGIYFSQLVTDDFQGTEKLVLVK